MYTVNHPRIINLIHWRDKKVAYTEGIGESPFPISAEDAAYQLRNDITIDNEDDAVTIEVYDPDTDTADNFTMLKGLPTWHDDKRMIDLLNEIQAGFDEYAETLESGSRFEDAMNEAWDLLKKEDR